MTDAVDTLLVDVRANTQGFAQDMAAMRGTFDGTLTDGFSKAGDVLERGLLGAIRKGNLGFDDLRRTAMGERRNSVWSDARLAMARPGRCSTP